MGRPKKNPADAVGKIGDAAQAEEVIPNEKMGIVEASPELTESESPAAPADVDVPEQADKCHSEPVRAQETAQTEASSGEAAEDRKMEDPAAKTTEADRVAELEALVQQMRAEMAAQRPQVVQVMADTEKVAMRFQSECADDNVAVFGPGGMYGQVTGKTGYVTVPKAEWSRFLTEQVRYLLDCRKLIVLSGLDDDEREMYGVNYREGELLDQRAFTKLLDLGRDLIAIFPRLCQSHQEMIASRFLTAYQNGDPRANDRQMIVALNELSKSGSGRGMFTPIIREMNALDELK